jgi:alpha-beta hydrolase superfamily lysophospholipase
VKKLICLLFAFVCVTAALAQTETKALARAKENMYLLKIGNFSSIEKRLDATMSRMIDASKLQGLWEGLQMQYGNLVQMGETSIKTKDSLYVCLTQLQFEKTKLNFKLVLNYKLQIAGLFLEPMEVPYAPAAWVDPRLFFEVKKAVPVAAYPSEGILTLPNVQEKVPLIIIVGGSGPTDKDLSMGPNRIYKDMAWGLATQGIASYRYDKRTRAYASKMGNPDLLTVKEEYLEDLQAIVAKFSKHESIDSSKVFILGHSEGGYLIPWFSSEVKGVKGFIIAAGNYNKMADMVSSQLLHLQKHTRSEQERAGLQAILARVPYAQHKLTLQSPKDSLPLGLSAAYMVFLNEKSPSNYLTALKGSPTLVLQGARDYQVPVTEFEAWKAALANHPQVTFQLYHQLNHIFMAGEGICLPAEYTEPGNVSKTMLLDIAAWIKAN